MSKRLPIPLLIAALALLVLPYMLLALGLTMTSASEVVIFATACMALNILVGHTGLVSFGHGAWFGLAAYAAAMLQRNWMHDSFFGPTIAGVLIVVAVAFAFGFLILRRRGVYFSLLTLALAAMLYAVSFRWTDVTGGENGLGGITRPTLVGINLESSTNYYWFVAAIAFLILILLWRFHRSTVGSVLVAIRENEQRARFLGYPTNRYKLTAFVLSAGITGLAGILLLFQNRMTSADPISVSFSGDLLAMVVIGGMRSFLGPALGALFFILFREFLGIYTENWLFWFGLVFVAFIVFSPTGLVGVAERLIAPFRKKVIEDAAMSARRIEVLPLPEFLRPASHVEGPVLSARQWSRASVVSRPSGCRHFRCRSHATRINRAERRRQDYGIQSAVWHVSAGPGHRIVAQQPIAGHTPEEIATAGIGRSFQITNLFPALSVGENIRLAVQARHPRRFDPLTNALSIEAINTRDRRNDPLSWPRRYREGGSRYVILWRATSAGHGLGACHRAANPVVGRAPGGPRCSGTRAYRRHHQANIVGPAVLLVEHDIDRVFQLADHVTVMNEGRVLLDGTVEDARPAQRSRKSISVPAQCCRRPPPRNGRRCHSAVDVDQCRYVLRKEPYPQ